jgi:hypothetical protein
MRDLMSGVDPLKPVASEQCTATSKRTRRRCGQLVPGGGVCRWHGGAAGQVSRQRQARLAAAEAQAMFADTYEPRDPGEALAAAAVNADQVLRSLQQKVELSGELRAHDLDALRTWMELVSRLSKAVLDARIDERRAQLSEQQGDVVVLALQAIFARLVLSEEQQRLVPIVVPAVLRAAASGDPRMIELAGRAE